MAEAGDDSEVLLLGEDSGRIPLREGDDEGGLRREVELPPITAARVACSHNSRGRNRISVPPFLINF